MVISPAEGTSKQSDDAVRPRAIFLGASNLVRGIDSLVTSTQLALGGPVEVIAAMGHGRSYNLTTTVLTRQLSGLLRSGIWDAVEKLPEAATYAVATDVGNDLLYEATPEQIARWVDEAIDRLQQVADRVILTGVPIESISALTPTRYYVVRYAFFPSARLTFDRATNYAFELHERLAEIAAGRSIPFAEQPGSWYGFDPVHHKPAMRGEAWRTILGHWNEQADEVPLARRSLKRELYLKWLAPEMRRIAWFQQRRVQPVGRLADGTTIALY